MSPNTPTVDSRQVSRFLVSAGMSVAVLSILWCWYGLAQLEAETDQGKALAAGTTMEGTAFWMGGLPLLVAHAILAAILLRSGWRAWRARGLWVGVLAVVVASAIGIGVGQIVFGGRLFEVGLHHYHSGT